MRNINLNIPPTPSFIEHIKPSRYKRTGVLFELMVGDPVSFLEPGQWHGSEAIISPVRIIGRNLKIARLKLWRCQDFAVTGGPTPSWEVEYDLSPFPNEEVTGTASL